MPVLRGRTLGRAAVCMYVAVRTRCIYVCIKTTISMYRHHAVCMCVCLYVFMYVCMHACMHAYRRRAEVHGSRDAFRDVSGSWDASRDGSRDVPTGDGRPTPRRPPILERSSGSPTVVRIRGRRRYRQTQRGTMAPSVEQQSRGGAGDPQRRRKLRTRAPPIYI